MNTGRFIRALAHDGDVRMLAVMADQAAEEMCQRHSLGGVAAELASSGMVASLLLSAHIKGEERILLEIAGDDPVFTFSGEAWADGAVRGRLSPGEMEPFSHLQGSLVAIKWDSQQEIYRGVAEVDHSSLEGALQAYFLQSQQTHGMVRLGARLNGEGKVVFAAGLLLELLPDGMSSEQFETLLESARNARLGELMTALAFGQVLGSEVELLEVREVTFQCNCSLARVESTLRALGAEDLRLLCKEQGHTMVTCHFCNSSYEIGGERLLALAAALES